MSTKIMLMHGLRFRAYPKISWWINVLQNIAMVGDCRKLLTPDRLRERMRGDPGNFVRSV
ncbi:MAG TPA: hypothetical protein VGT41_02350 [Candidatus Babeliales bacterium]|nr:hypothetical protein [Candidatus Babeliales bacterium]